MDDIILDLSEMQKELSSQINRIEKNYEKKMADIGSQVYFYIIEELKKSSKSSKNIKNYLEGLTLSNKNGRYTISLETELSMNLELGFSGYDLKKKLLDSNSTVKSGPRVGESWVQRSQKGDKFASVPMDKKELDAKANDLISKIKDPMRGPDIAKSYDVQLSVPKEFRNVSENSKGWKHPGFKGYKIFQRAEIYLKNLLANVDLKELE